MTGSLTLHDFPFYSESFYSETIGKGLLRNVFSLSPVQISVWTYTFPLPSMCFFWVSIYSPPVIFSCSPPNICLFSKYLEHRLYRFFLAFSIFSPLIQKIYFLCITYYPYSKVSLFPNNSCSYKKAVILFVGCLISSNQPSSGMWR